MVLGIALNRWGATAPSISGESAGEMQTNYPRMMTIVTKGCVHFILFPQDCSKIIRKGFRTLSLNGSGTLASPGII